MPRQFAYLKLLLVMCLFYRVSIAQGSAPQPASTPFDVTPEETRVCNEHNYGHVRCLLLALEFRRTHELQTSASAVNLDTPFAQTDDFAARVAPKALLKLLESSVVQQTARQVLSTSAANTQIGGAPTATGSTNLVSKPTTTDFISAAAESGAFTDTINGTTMTIQANALGLTKYFYNKPIFEQWRSRYADVIQPLSFTVTLNVAQTGSTSATTTAPANPSTPASITSVLLPTNNASFSSFGVNYSVHRPYSPQDPKFLTSWKSALTSNHAALQDAGKRIAADVYKLFPQDVFKDIQKKMQGTGPQPEEGTPMADWHRDGTAAEQAGNFDAFVTAYSTYEDKYAQALLDSPDAPKNLLALSQAIDAFTQVVYNVLDDARGKPLATLSYLYSTPQDKPATHSFTAVVSYLFKGDDPKKRTPLTGAQLTANFTTSIYASLPAGAAYGRLRDFQLSGEFDKPFGGTPDEPRGTWSLAGYGQYQYDPTVLTITAGNLVPGTNIPLPGDAQVLLGTAGWLAVAQGKLVINLKKGLSIPVAVKWSNKTDLLKGDDVRGQVGLSYDLSALSKLISPAKN
ncbi:MAG: hypothetical protein WCE73_20170 [Candidatus Angelobacter sp.]